MVEMHWFSLLSSRIKPATETAMQLSVEQFLPDDEHWQQPG